MASRFLFTIARVRIPSFFGWIPFLCVYTTTFIWSPHPRWTVGSLAPFAAVMNTAPRMGVLVGVQPLFSVFGVYTLMWMWWITGKFYSEVLRNWHTVFHISSVQFSSVAQSCPTLCDPMNRSTPGLPVHHQLPESTQTHVHRVSDAIQPSHPLSSPSPPALNPSQHQSLFQWVNSFHIACTISLDFFYGKIIVVYGSTPIGLSIYPLVSICTISPFWVLWRVLLSAYVNTCFHFFGVHIQE